MGADATIRVLLCADQMPVSIRIKIRGWLGPGIITPVRRKPAAARTPPTHRYFLKYAAVTRNASPLTTAAGNKIARGSSETGRAR
jgi:hypothetical protein